MPAMKQHKKLLPPWLLCGGTVLLAALVGTSTVALAQTNTLKACLVHTIDASQWSPPSPDPMGMTYDAQSGHLLISDSEVEECVNGQLPVYWHGVNLFEANTSGKLLGTATTYTHASGTCPTSPTGTPSNFTDEPTGVTINPANGHFFFTDDDAEKVFEVDLGGDGQYGTADDTITHFSTPPLNPSAGIDPEGMAFAHGDMFLVSGGPSGGGGTAEVYQIAPG